MRGVFTPGKQKSGNLLVLSGLDGTGKSTQAGILVDRLKRKGITVRTVWNRWKPLISVPIVALARKTISRDKDAPTAQYEEFTRVKKEKMKHPLKQALWQLMVWSEYALEANIRLRKTGHPFRNIISDRYIYDTLIDIAVNFSLEPGDLETLCNHTLLSLFPIPTEIVVIDIDPLVGTGRKRDGTPPEYLADRREFYIEMARITGAALVNGNGTVEETASSIWENCRIWRENLLGTET
jgi:thymidylate kinase